MGAKNNSAYQEFFVQQTDLEIARASFERAVTFLRGGDAETAEKVCRKGLQEVPNDPNLLCLLGAALLQQDRPSQAERPLSKAVEMYPGFSKGHEGLAEVYLLQGKLPAALECLQTASRLEPDSASIKLKLGKVLTGLGRGDDASAEFEASFKLTPFREELVRGLQMQRMGNLKEAEKIYRGVLLQDPNDVDALRLLAGLAMRAKHWGDAEVLLTKALALAPDFFQGWMDLGLAHQEQDQMEEAKKALERAMTVKPELPNAFTAYGTVCAMSGDHHGALDYFEQAVSKQAGNAGALAGLGHVLKTIGRQDDAIQAYRECAEHNPGHGEAYWSLANLKTFRFGDAEIDQMQAQIASPDLPPEPRANFLFALGKAFEDRGQFDQAFDYYQQGNQTRRQLESYDPVNTLDSHDNVVRVFDSSFFESHAGLGHGDDAAIFIVGLPRSGSTLLEQILASHSMVEGTHELPELSRVARSTRGLTSGQGIYPDTVLGLNPEQFAELGRDYLERAQRHREMAKPRFTDKLPNNFVHVGFLHSILPNAKVIDARRHPLDSCVGSYKQLFARGQPFTYDLYEIGEFYLEYRRVMDHWNQVLPGKVLTVQYEHVVQDLEGQVATLLSHCDLDMEPECLQFYQTDRAVKTASSEQVRQPIYSSSVQSWRRFESHLGPLIEVLEPLLKELPEDWQPEKLRRKG